VRTSAKVAAWAVAFAVAAGAGAYVAAHTDPFPPGVSDPGERPPSGTPTRSVSPSEEPVPRRWQFHAVASSEHRLHVGGTCRRDWDVQALLREHDDGTLHGTGLATVRDGAGCPFTTADVQTETVILRVASPDPLADGIVALVFRVEGDLQPGGSKDLGGFVALLPGLRVGHYAPRRTVAEAGDGNDGSYRVVWTDGRLRCAAGC
jgi:hypothetical protein